MKGIDCDISGALGGSGVANSGVSSGVVLDMRSDESVVFDDRPLNADDALIEARIRVVESFIIFY